MFATAIIKLIEGDKPNYSLKVSTNNGLIYLTLNIKDYLFLDEDIFNKINKMCIIQRMNFFNKGEKIIIVLKEK